MTNPAGVALQEPNVGQPPVPSYVDGHVAGKRIQPPAVIVSPTAPWSCADKSLGSQLPKPVRAAAKGNEDTVMQEASNLCLQKPVSKSEPKLSSFKPVPSKEFLCQRMTRLQMIVQAICPNSVIHVILLMVNQTNS